MLGSRERRPGWWGGGELDASLSPLLVRSASQSTCDLLLGPDPGTKSKNIKSPIPTRREREPEPCRRKKNHPTRQHCANSSLFTDAGGHVALRYALYVCFPFNPPDNFTPPVTEEEAELGWHAQVHAASKDKAWWGRDWGSGKGPGQRREAQGWGGRGAGESGGKAGPGTGGRPGPAGTG